MPFTKGQSGNPNGRPVKNRALTEILKRAGSKTLDVDGKRVSGKRLIACMLWSAATTGTVTFPNGKKLTVDADDWFGIVKWIYSHIDGPPKAESAMELTGVNGTPLVIAIGGIDPQDDI